MLDRKLLRDLRRLRGQAVAIALMVACAVATYVGSVATYRSLLLSQARYYEQYRFADAFATLNRAPEEVAARLLDIPGVSEVQTRVAAMATLEVAGLAEPANAQMVSIPDGAQPRLDRVFLREGRLPDPQRPWEVLVHEAFASANRLHPGDTLPAVIRGHRHDLHVAGIALAPDFVYAVRPGDLMPDDRRFGVIWAQRRALGMAADLDGAFNQVSLRLAPGAPIQDVLAAVDRLLAPYGCGASGGRDTNISHRFLTDEIRGLKSTAVFVPTLFLGVAAFLLNVVLVRLVGTQREQIGTMKALGVSNGEVGWHYAKLVGAIVLAGVVLGVGLGAWMGTWWTRLYAAFYRMPVWSFVLDPDVALSSVGIALAAGGLGLASAVRRAVSLPPAEAMRPPSPPVYRRTLFERLVPASLLGPSGRMILRDIARRPVRTALSSLGIGMAVAILVAGSSMFDAMDVMMDAQFGRALRDDVSVSFVEASGPTALEPLRALPGVRIVEGFRAVPVTLRHGHREYVTAITGLAPDGALRRVTDRHGSPIALPEDGVMLTLALARRLGLAPGDVVTAEVMEGRRPRWDLVVTATADELMGSQGWMSLPALARRLDDGGTLSGAALRVDPDARPALYDALRAMPGVAGVTALQTVRRSFDEVMAQYVLGFAAVLVGFAALMAAGVVYNAARVSLAERERELASMRVLGFTRAEVSGILLGELAVHVALALPAGCVLGWGFAWAMAAGFDNDLYRLPTTILPPTYAMACLTVVVVALVVALAVRRRLDRLDLVSVLKTRE
jgi:putative ABC transport system permease protein